MEPIAAPRAVHLADRLLNAGAELVAVIEAVDEARWGLSSGSGVWSIGKEAEHVAEAGAYHQWIVRLTIGEKVSARRPAIERSRMTSDRSPAEVAALIRYRTEEASRLLRSLTDAQLDLRTRPHRAHNQRLVETIELVLIDHYDGHRREIEAKLRAMADA